MSMSIPVLPHGPLSVRCFVLETSDGGSHGRNCGGAGIRGGGGGSGVGGGGGGGGGGDGGGGGGGGGSAQSSTNGLDMEWKRNPGHTFITLDEEGPQEFAVMPPIEAKYVRLVCLSNAADDPGMPFGFWEIAFW